MTHFDLDLINAKILSMKKTAEELNQLGNSFPALIRNTARILASLKMLEINVSDVVDLARDVDHTCPK